MFVAGQGAGLVIYLLVGLSNPLPDGKKFDASHVRTSPLVRTASTGMFSFVILGGDLRRC